MKKHLVILISGTQGSGKSTLSRGIKNSINETMGHLAVGLQKFADPLYDMQEAIRAVLKNKYDFHYMPEKDGDLLQLLGTEWGRKKYGENIWVNLAGNKTKMFERGCERFENNSVLIIDDCRFENEFNAYPKALKIRLWAPENVRKERAESWRENTAHASEVSLDEYDKAGKFDMYLNTSTMSKEECLVTVLEEVRKRLKV